MQTVTSRPERMDVGVLVTGTEARLGFLYALRFVIRIKAISTHRRMLFAPL